MAPRRGDDADRDNAERVIHRQGGDGGGRTAAGGAGERTLAETIW